jgi:FkbM family methyltransferase
MISYAQNFEDVMLERVFRGQSQGFYVDVGAWHPIVDSVTAHFYAKGWSGINVEPEPFAFSQVAEARPRDVNLDVALGDAAGEKTFYLASGCSSFVREYAERWLGPGSEVAQVPVRVTTLGEVCRQYAREPIDFLKIDVEGWEREVIAGGDWERFRPRVVLVEATVPNTSAPAHESFEQLLAGAGYVFVYFDGLNRFYVREEDRDLKVHFRTPPNVFDAFLLASTHRLREGAPDYTDPRALFASLRSEIERLHGECASRDSRLREIDSEFASVRESHAAQEALVREKHAEVDRLHRECAARDERLRSQGLEVERLGLEIERLGLEIERGEREIERLSLEVERRGLDRERLEAECARRDRIVEQLYASTSWRLTAPLRSLSRILSRRPRG